MSDYLKEGFIDEVKGALKGEGGSGQDNVIEKIKVNGVEQAVDPNKAVDIPVPTKTSELENDEGFLTEHQDLSDYAKKADVPTVPTNVSEFTNDSDYQTADDVSNALEPYAKSSDVTTQITEGIAKVVADAPEDFDTLKEMSDWIASHENDASAMNSAIQDNKNGISELNTNMADHTGNKNNPHGVTKDQVGLGNVDNTTDLDKPVSKAQATAIADAKKAGTDAQNNLKSHTGNTNNPHSVTKSQVGLGNVGNFKAVSTVASQGLSDTEKSNARTNIGLDKVDNTADLDKPISTATQTALDDINRNLDTLSYDDYAGGKNLFKVNTTDWTLTDNGIKNNARNIGKTLGKAKLIAGKTYKISLLLKRKPTVDTSFTGYIDGTPLSDIISFPAIQTYALGVKSEKNYTPTSDCELSYILWGNGNSDIFEFQLQVEEGSTATDYEPYIPSVKMLAEETENINESLEYYGIVNQFDGELVNGYFNTDGFGAQANFMSTENIISCSPNDDIDIKVDTDGDIIRTVWYKDGNFVNSMDYYLAAEKKFTVPNDVNGVRICFYKTNSDSILFKKLSVYINNEIDSLKKDLGNYAPKANPTFTGTVQVGSKGIVAVNADDEQIALELQGVTIGTDGDYLDAFELREQGDPLSVLYMAKSTGADYAEYFEWTDKNPNDEDRVGYFVTFDENDPEKIRYANEGDYILGIVSGTPNVIGNDDNGWSNRYILDEFGRRIEEEFEFEETVIDEETGEKTTVTKTRTKWKENPDYDESKPYVPRKERPEWSAIGMLGVLSVYDDGTCQVNGYCKCSDNGVATSSEDGYRIIARVSDNIIKIVFR